MTDARLRVVVEGTDKGKRELAELGKGFAELGARVAATGKVAGKVAASFAGVASLTGPAVAGLLGVAKAVVAVGKGLATLPPLVALLPSLAAGGALVLGTMKMAGPAIGRALSPVAAAFTGLQGQVGALATKGLPELARGFVKVNFPSIRRAMLEIADDMNTVVQVTGKWINSASGQQAIRQLTLATSDATERLDGRVARLAVSFGELVKRMGGRAISGVTDLIVKATEATIRWMDALDNNDVDRALASLSGWGGKIKDTFIVLRDVGRWMAENEGKVKAFSDVVAGMAIVVGVATGNWLAVLAGSFSLAVNHWDGLKAKFAEGGPFFSRLWAGIKNDPNLRGIWDSARVAFAGFADSFREGIRDIGPRFTAAIAEWRKAWEEWGPLVKAWWDGVGKPVFSALGTALAFLAVHFATSMVAGGKMADFVGTAFKSLLSIALNVLGGILTGATKAFGWIPGVGDRLRQASAEFEAFRSRVNAALLGIKDRHVVVSATYVSSRANGVSVGEGNSRPVRGAFAEGGTARVAGSYLVGERGREIVELPAGARVRNAADTRAALTAPAAPTAVALVSAPSGNSAVATLIEHLIRTGDLRLRVVNGQVTAGAF